MVFQIKKGLSENLFAQSMVLEEGCWYLTTDTEKLYVCVNGGLVAINETESFDPTEINEKISTLEDKVTALENEDNIHSGDLIYGGTSAEFTA